MKEDKYPIERFCMRSTEEVETWEDGYDYMEKEIKKILKDMPDTFPELERDDYDQAYQDAKQYILDKL